MLKSALSELEIKFLLDSRDFFLGILDRNSNKFIFINQKGLDMFLLADLTAVNTFFTENTHRNASDIFDFKINVSKDLEFTKSDHSTFTGKYSFETLGENSSKVLIKIEDKSITDSLNEKLKDIEARTEAIVHYAALGIILVNEDRDIVFSNKHALELFDYKIEDLIGKSLDILIPDHLKERHKHLQSGYIAKPVSRPMGQGLALLAKKSDASLFPVEISLSFFESNNHKYFVAFISDVSQKKKSEELLLEKTKEIEKLNDFLESEVIKRTKDLNNTLSELEKSKIELEKALKKEIELGELKSRFVSMASHEFRTPLTTINSAASLIEKFPKSEDQNKRETYLYKIKLAVNNLTDILEEFLNVGKLEEGKIFSRIKAFDIKDLMDDLILDMTPFLKENQKIIFSFNGDKMVNSDNSLIRKIVINLLSNAIKFSNAGNNIYLNISYENKLEIEVIDEGIGISVDDQKHLFDRFFRGSNVLNIQGTGLGLHIVGRYTELLKGQVSIKSELEKGTKIKLIFPKGYE